MSKIEEKFNYNLLQLYKKLIRKNNPGEKEVLSFMISCLKYIDNKVGVLIDYQDLDDIVNICSLKYMVFVFNEENFTIKYCFNYYRDYVKRLIDDEVEMFFKEKMNLKHTGYKTGDYFEKLSSKALYDFKLKLPIYGKNTNKIEFYVEEIATMKEILTSVKSKNNNLRTRMIELQKYEVKKEDLLKEINDDKSSVSIFNCLKKYVFLKDDDIYRYKIKYIDSMENKYSIKGTEKFADFNIFIKQKSQKGKTGKTIDYCYLTGEKNKKILYTFQMKAYSDTKDSVSFNKTKLSIKNDIKEILVNSKYLFGVNIVGWHYIMIILLEKKEEKFNYRKKLVEKCKKNGLEYIFFDPFSQIFYDKTFVELTNFQGNVLSDLNYELIYYFTKPFSHNIIISKYKKLFKDNFLDAGVTQFNYLKYSINEFLGIKLGRDTIQDVRAGLSKIIGQIALYFKITKIKLLGAYKNLADEIIIPKPNWNFLFLFQKINKNKSFIILFNDEKCTSMFYDYDSNTGEINRMNIVNNEIDKKRSFFAFIIEVPLNKINIKEKEDNIISIEELDD